MFPKILEEGILLEIKDNKIVVGFSRSSSLHKEVLDSVPNKNIIKDVVKQILEVDLGFDFVFSKAAEKTEEGEAASSDVDEGIIPQPSKKVEPIVESAMEMFKGQIIKEGYSKEDRR